MEAELVSLDHCTELSTVTNTDLHKAWHLLGLLLTIGRPVRTTELASRCTLFRAPPELVEYICSIPNSPLRLTGDLFVTLSSVAILAFGQFVVNANTVTSFVRPIGLGGFRPKRIWEYVERTHCRKRRRVRSDFDDLPAIKDRAFWQNMNEEETDQNALALPYKIEDACSKAPICTDMSRRMITQAASTSTIAFTSENPNQAMVTTSNDGCLIYEMENAEHGSQGEECMSLNTKELGFVCTSEGQQSFLNYERFPHFLDAITAERTTACITNPEVSIQTSTMENRVMLREGNNMNDSYSTSRIDINATHCQEVDKPMMISPVEAQNVIYACKDIVKLAEDERAVDEREKGQFSDSVRQKIDVENLQANTANVNESCEDDFTAKIAVKGIATIPSHVESQGIFSADLLSLDQKQPTKSLANIKTVQKDALNPVLQALSRTIENSAVGARIDQQHKKSISIKQKLLNNYDQKMLAKEKKESSKENREKPTSTSLKNQPEPKVLPNFESFIVKEEEGSGGYGTVYRAQRKNDGATFAIKCPHANANRHHVYNELKMLERFGGKNFVIKYEGSFKSGGSDCLVLEHVEHDRPEVLKREIDVFQLQWYGYCLFRALAALHKQGVVHRDVKPGNFLFSRKVNKGYLIDFNLAMDLQQKYGTTDRSTSGYDATRVKSLPPTKSRKFPTTKALELANQEPVKGSKSLALPKNLKRKTDQIKEHANLSTRNVMKSQGADGSGITSAKEATSSRIPSGERLREPIPCQGRKELISLVQEAMQGPNHEVTSVPSSKRKRVAAPPGRVESKVVYFTPMPLHSIGVPVAGAGLQKNKGEGKHKREGPCVGTKGFRAPEVLFRSQHQGPKIDIWSAGVTLLYLITGRTPFVGDPDQNIKEIAKLRGSEDLWEVAKLHNRESSFPPNLFDVQFLTSTKLTDWCKLITRRPDFHDILPRSLFDLVNKCLTVNPRVRISAEEALRHEFFAPCHERLRKQRLLRQQGLSFDSATTIDVLSGGTSLINFK